MSKIEVNTVDVQCGSTLTLGSSGKTVTLACGATQSGFGRTGTVDWCTTVKTSPLTATSGKGYFVNTCGGAVTVTLPASPSAGDIVALADYNNTWATACKAVTLNNNSKNINGVCGNATLSTEGQSVSLVYVDTTRGWKTVTDSTSDVSGAPTYIVATGGTISTSGDYRIHKFTADACFAVESAPTPANNTVSYVVVAGGGGGAGAGGGAGGFREGKCSSDPYTDSPLDAGTGLPVSASTTYPITVGGGGAGGNAWDPGARVTSGSNSVFSSKTSTGGGNGGWNDSSTPNGGAGGSGGGAGNGPAGPGSVGSGNSPPVSPSQGFAGGLSSPGPGANVGWGAGGGASAVGTAGSQSPPPGTAPAGNGGAGVTTSITASPIGYAGGGGGGAQTQSPSPTGGGTASQGGGNGASGDVNGISGTVNTGGGGGGNGSPTSYTAGAGGSGIVVVRYKFQ